MSPLYTRVVGLGLGLLLSACGGNGGGGGMETGNVGSGGLGSTMGGVTPVVDAVAEGAWSGSNSPGNVFDMLILEDGELYFLFGSNFAGVFSGLGFDVGSSRVSGTTLSAPVIQYNFNGTMASGTLTATVVSGTSIQGAATGSSGGTTTFEAIPMSQVHTGYDYHTPAAIRQIEGTWSGRLFDQTGQSVLTVDAAGAIAATNLGCSYTGSVTPRASGKNVFDIRLAFGASPCTLPNQTVTGIAVSYLAANGQRQLTAALRDATKTRGAMLFAQR